MGHVNTGSRGDGQSRAPVGSVPSLQPREGLQEPVRGLRFVAEPTAPALHAPCFLPSLLTCALGPGRSRLSRWCLLGYGLSQRSLTAMLFLVYHIAESAKQF